MESSEEAAFVTEEVEGIVNSVAEELLKDQYYNESMVPQWIDRVCEGCMTKLSELGKPFKYIVTCCIMQKNGAGVHSASSCFDHPETDGVHCVRWPPEKHKDHNRYLYAIVTVFGSAL